MKVGSIVVLFLLLISCNAKQKNYGNKCIGFYHEGLQTGIYKTLLVSTRLIDIHFSDLEASTIRPSKDSLTWTDGKRLYFSSNYIIAVTDKTTDSILRKFIYSHKKDFINFSEYKKTGYDETFTILVDSKDEFLINPEKMPTFFSEMRNILEKQKCDEMVIHFLP